MKKVVINCKVCRSKSEKIFSKQILGKYIINYYRCSNCGLIQTEKPFWLKEAYSSAIIDSDTGIISRNIVLSKITSIFLLFFGKKPRVLDYGGGYGLMTRILRDIGIDCYWTDKYAENIFARGFEDRKNIRYGVVTAFELFEHFEDPVKELSQIIKTYKPKTIIFSTMLHNGDPPKDWWYFAPEGGQHITLYTKKSLQLLAQKFGMRLSTNGRNIHVFSDRRISGLLMKLISIFWSVFPIISPIFYKSKTFSDRTKITSSK